MDKAEVDRRFAACKKEMDRLCATAVWTASDYITDRISELHTLFPEHEFVYDPRDFGEIKVTPKLEKCGTIREIEEEVFATGDSPAKERARLIEIALEVPDVLEELERDFRQYVGRITRHGPETTT